MSLAINVTTPSGIVLAADSRQTYRNQKGMVRIGSDNATKIFQINRHIGIAITGLAFLPENGIPKNISNFIEEFKKQQESSLKEALVGDVAKLLYDFFDGKYDYKSTLKELPRQIKIDIERQGFEVIGEFEVKEPEGIIKYKFKDPSGKVIDAITAVEKISLLVAGYNSDGSHEGYNIYIPGLIQKQRDSKERGKEYGASWIGQHDVVARIVLGRDWRLNILPFVAEAMQQKSQEEIMRQLQGLEYQIGWGIMTLQDAIDFCVLAIQTTSAIQRFSDGVAMDPGDIPGVGGPIDIAAITPNKGFTWIQKKKLKTDLTEIDLDQLESHGHKQLSI